MTEVTIEKRTWRLRALLLALVINAAVWAGYFVWGLWQATGWGVIVGVFVLARILAITSIGIVVVHFGLCRTRHTLVRWVAYTLPAVLLLTYVFLVPTRSDSTQPVNQIWDLASPSGEYRLTMPITDGTFRLTIHDNKGSIKYQDKGSQLTGWFSAYWIWDTDSRAWLYDSTSGKVFVYEIDSAGRWTKTEWGHEHTKTLARDIVPPDSLYPKIRKGLSKRGRIAKRGRS